MPVTKPCESCGKPVTRPPSQMRGTIYCSRECSYRKKYTNIPIIKICENCGKEFSKLKKESWVYWESKKFCSHPCYAYSLIGQKNPKISETFKNLWNNDPTFQQKMMNRPLHSDETKRKIREAFKGRKLTNEHRQKISNAVKGVNHPLYGKKMNPESIRKMADKKRGVPLSEETKRKISERFKGRKLSESTKRKLSKITKEKWANDPEFVQKVLTGLSGSKNGTSIERKVAAILVELGVEFVFQKVISRCIVDFYIPAQKKIIEADGDYWHNLPEVKKRDRLRDFFLKDRGFTILRLTESEINDDPLPKIIKFLKK
jgi:very-short-patch-repair endonuclease